MQKMGEDLKKILGIFHSIASVQNKVGGKKVKTGKDWIEFHRGRKWSAGRTLDTSGLDYLPFHKICEQTIVIKIGLCSFLPMPNVI